MTQMKYELARDRYKQNHSISAWWYIYHLARYLCPFTVWLSSNL